MTIKDIKYSARVRKYLNYCCPHKANCFLFLHRYPLVHSYNAISCKCFLEEFLVIPFKKYKVFTERTTIPFYIFVTYIYLVFFAT